MDERLCDEQKTTESFHVSSQLLYGAMIGPTGSTGRVLSPLSLGKFIDFTETPHYSAACTDQSKICLLYRIHINQSSYRLGIGRLGTCTLKKQYNLDFLYLLLYGRLYSSQSSQTFRICRRCLLL